MKHWLKNTSYRSLLYASSLALLIGLFGTVLMARPAQAAGCYSSAVYWDRDDTLLAYAADWCIASANGHYKLIFQRSDGNLVVYRHGTAIWQSNTAKNGNRFAMQGDGNLVVYNYAATALWASNSRTSSGTIIRFMLTMQDDGNLVLYSGRQGATAYSTPIFDRVLWSIR